MHLLVSLTISPMARLAAQPAGTAISAACCMGPRALTLPSCLQIDTDHADETFEALSKYGNDLTAQAPRLDPVIGRDEEIRRVIRVLCRRTKNNPVLVGDPGGQVLLACVGSCLGWCSADFSIASFVCWLTKHNPVLVGDPSEGTAAVS